MKIIVYLFVGLAIWSFGMKRILNDNSTYLDNMSNEIVMVVMIVFSIFWPIILVWAICITYINKLRGE